MERSFLEILCGIHKFDRMIIQMGATTLSVMTLSLRTLSIRTLSVMTLSLRTLSIMTFIITINQTRHSA
jgi:hypothetical protein